MAKFKTNVPSEKFRNGQCVEVIAKKGESYLVRFPDRREVWVDSSEVVEESE